ncbi:MAG TPA: hypothetical protein VGH65_10695, partial [Verrucomicrobiaceae bacterium]
MSERTAAPVTESERRFDWPVCYEAENFILGQLDEFVARNSFAKDLSGRLAAETGTLLLDWTDSVTIPFTHEAELRRLGFVPDHRGDPPATRQKVLYHPDSVLPCVIVDSSNGGFPTALDLHPENVADFLGANGVTAPIEGSPLTRFRRALVSFENDTSLSVVERRGYRGFVPAKANVGEIEALLAAMELWQTRPRHFQDDDAGYRVSLSLIDQIVAMVGINLACHAVFVGERQYWQRRNRAARVQKARQDRLGLGWGNHDHHTFRSSRSQFVNLMRAMEKLGFERRERYYAGAQAGWGAQIMEQPVEGIVVFCDVDLRPEDSEIDFSRELLEPAGKLGTVGLWCGLHGESFLDAGMHHLEARFDHALCRDQLSGLGINTMKPFSDFDFLK